MNNMNVRCSYLHSQVCAFHYLFLLMCIKQITPELNESHGFCGCLELDYMKGGNLHEWLQKHGRNKKELKRIFRLIGDGISHCHSKGIIHRYVVMVISSIMSQRGKSLQTLMS